MAAAALTAETSSMSAPVRRRMIDLTNGSNGEGLKPKRFCPCRTIWLSQSEKGQSAMQNSGRFSSGSSEKFTLAMLISAVTAPIDSPMMPMRARSKPLVWAHF